MHAPQERFRRLSPPGDQTERRRRFYAEVDTESVNGGFSVRLDGRTPRSPDGAALVLPTEALDVHEKGRHSEVELTLQKADLVQARWNDGDLPQTKEYATVSLEKLPPFPEDPKKFLVMDRGPNESPLDFVVHFLPTEGDTQRVEVPFASEAEARFVAQRLNEMLASVRGGANQPQNENRVETLLHS